MAVCGRCGSALQMYQDFCRLANCPMPAAKSGSILPLATQLAEMTDTELLSLARDRQDDLLVQALANRIEDLTHEEN